MGKCTKQPPGYVFFVLYKAQSSVVSFYLSEGNVLNELLEKLILTLMCATLLFGLKDPDYIVVALLSVVAVSSIMQVSENRVCLYLLAGLFICACFISDSFVIFLPVIVYDLFRDRLYPLFLPALGALFFRNYDGLSWQLFLAILIFTAVSFIIEYLDRRMSALSHELIVTRDNAVEYSNELKNKNQRILEAQDTEIHLATLKERNRIAREIHDNVGHMLTRTILQTGALQIINKDENLKEPLESIKNTLDEAMNQVRKSVHDLHDDSVDLERSLKEAIEPLRERFAVTFEYDISENVNGKIKYCFIALVKEAVNNIIKHSNGDRALITLREHPGMFTLLVQDNGNCEGKNISEGGIGLTNIRERVQAMNGNLNISAGKEGFKIFASIMKGER